MFVFGHLGIGLKLASPWTEGLSKRTVLVGTLLPDLIDKAGYYGLSWLTGKRGADLGLISGTETFGHTALFLLLFAINAFITRSKTLAALAIGVATHLILDNVADHFRDGDGAFLALVFPLKGAHFSVLTSTSFLEHAAATFRPAIVVGEAIGLFLLVWDWWKTRHEAEIITDYQIRRFRLKRR